MSVELAINVYGTLNYKLILTTLIIKLQEVFGLTLPSPGGEGAKNKRILKSSLLERI
jgi:hypothetical protein